MDLNLADKIRERAYFLWLANGSCNGDAEQHWLTAEREILQSGNSVAAIAKVTPGPKRASAKKTTRPMSRATPKAIAALVN